MKELPRFWRFMGSRSGRGFLLHLGVCAALSVAVGCGFYYFSLNWFKEHKSSEKITALQLVDAFVTNYSALRSQLGSDAPVPASFRAHAIEAFNKLNGQNSEFRLASVGRPGREILTAPSDEKMAEAVEAFAAMSTPKPVSEFLDVNGQFVFRTVYPTIAQEQSCVSCHNALQPDKPQWHLNDVIGAFVIDVPMSAFLRSVIWQSAGIGLGLFLALSLAGLTISLVHFRQLEALDRSAAKLGRTQKFLDTIIENMPLSVAVRDVRDRCLVLINRTAEAIFGIERGNLIGKAMHGHCEETEQNLFPLADEALTTLDLQTIGEHTVATPHNGARILNTRNFSIPDETGEQRYLLSLSEDITERKEAEARIEHMAHHDALTDLPNRLAFVEHLSRSIDAAAAGNGSFAVLSIDLDRFKEVNDTFGHAVGDDLLRAAGATTARRSPQNPTWRGSAATNLSVITPIGDQPALAEMLAGQLHASGRRGFRSERPESARRSQHRRRDLPGGRDRCDDAAAQCRCRALPRQGRGPRHVPVLRDRDGQPAARAARISSTICARAFERNEFRLHYQPQAKIDGRDRSGFEALVRWHHPQRGMVSPATSSRRRGERPHRPARRMGAARGLPRGGRPGRARCRSRSTCRRSSSATAICRGLVHAVLLETGLAADTAGAGDHRGRADRRLRRGACRSCAACKALGVRIAMDDFGTGYSSLSYLQSFPFDKIKIDQSFISNVERIRSRRRSCGPSSGSARGLNLPVLAEGVETKRSLIFSPPNPATKCRVT